VFFCVKVVQRESSLKQCDNLSCPLESHFILIDRASHDPHRKSGPIADEMACIVEERAHFRARRERRAAQNVQMRPKRNSANRANIRNVHSIRQHACAGDRSTRSTLVDRAAHRWVKTQIIGIENDL
jgi:hypothetical protein